ncbi:MAG: 30S ribosomal protein S16 [Pseudomonadota bacterium]
MVVIRLARWGARKKPFYHVVVTDSRSARDGRHLERVGYFNPMARGQAKPFELKLDRIAYWVSEGASVSDRVSTLLKKISAAPATESVA